MKKEEIDQAIRELDLTDVAFKLSQMALKVISGKKLENKEYQIPFSIPEELAELFELLAEKTGVSIEEMLGHLATEGFNYTIASKVQKEEPAKPSDIEAIEKMATAAGVDMSGLNEGLSKMQGLADQLKSLESVVANVDSREPEKDPIKSNISLRPLPECKPGK